MLQLVATGAAALPLLLHLRGDAVTNGELAGSALFTTFAGTASAALWFYGQRYVGELALCSAGFVAAATEETAPPAALQHFIADSTKQVSTSKNDATTQHACSNVEVASDTQHAADAELWVRLSTLDFWGRRQVCFQMLNHDLRAFGCSSRSTHR